MLAAGLGGRVNQFSLDRASRGAVLQKSGLEGRAVPSLATFSKTCRVRTSMSLAGPAALPVATDITVLPSAAVLAEDSGRLAQAFSNFYRWLGNLGRPGEDDLGRQMNGVVAN